ncbi:MAG: hypothetical protein ABJA34_01375, partial [Pseudonocardiales bacterium]
MAASLRRELIHAGGGSLALAVLMTWPTLRHPATTIPASLNDPSVETWMAAWAGHALRTGPLHLFQANTFWPLPDSYAFNDTLLGYAPFTLLGGGARGALVTYNLLFVLAYAIAFAGAYLLARQLGARPLAALIAGAAFAYAPWRVAHSIHLNILSSGGIPLCLALLARGHGYGGNGCDRSQVRPWYAALGWAVAAWQVSLGFALGIPFLYVLLVVALAAVGGWLLCGRPSLPSRLLLTDLGGGLSFVTVTLVLAIPYLRVIAVHPEARRGTSDVARFSPPISGYLIAPDASRMWGYGQAAARAHLGWATEMALLPGFTLLLLAGIGLIAGAAPLRRRICLLAVVATSVLIGLGTTLAGGRYTIVILQAYVPGWQSVRTTGRLVLYTTLALALLAAYAVNRLQDVLPRTRLVAVALLVLPALVLAEGVGVVPHPRMPAVPAALRHVKGPVLVLPSDYPHDALATYWSTQSWPRMANGSTSVEPRQIDRLRERTRAFPDAASVAYLRQLGVRTVVLLPGSAAGTPWEGAERRPVDGLPVTRRHLPDG